MVQCHTVKSSFTAQISRLWGGGMLCSAKWWLSVTMRRCFSRCLWAAVQIDILLWFGGPLSLQIGASALYDQSDSSRRHELKFTCYFYCNSMFGVNSFHLIYFTKTISSTFKLWSTIIYVDFRPAIVFFFSLSRFDSSAEYSGLTLTLWNISRCLMSQYFDYVSRQLRLLRGCLWSLQCDDWARTEERRFHQDFYNGCLSVFILKLLHFF